MRWKVFFSALCMVLIVIIGILAIRISSLHSLNSFQIGNLEVLTASETYYLDDCQYGTTFGSNMVYDSFYNGPLKLDTELRQIKTLNFVVEYGKDITQKVHA